MKKLAGTFPPLVNLVTRLDLEEEEEEEDEWEDESDIASILFDGFDVTDEVLRLTPRVSRNFRTP